MKGIVLVCGDKFATVSADAEFKVVSLHGDLNGKWMAAAMFGAYGRDSELLFGPAFTTEAEALALARSAAVALAEGTGGVFGEPRLLKAGDRVTYAEKGSNFGDGGVVVSADDGEFVVRWDDEDGECAYEWSDVGVYLDKAVGPA